MVSRISTTRQFKQALLYNERKVKLGRATFLDGGYFIEDPEQLSIQEKFARLYDRMQLNDRAQVKTVHFSLNFDRQDQLTDQDLKRISAVFLRKVGLANQPYLLYEHHDAAHKHVHIVSTLIRPDGTKIKTQGLTLDLLKNACREIEADYGLKSGETRRRQSLAAQPEQASKLVYGKSELKTAMAAVLKNVLDDFCFTSLSELNAILRQYNIQASRGRPGSRLYTLGGLIYRALDEKGRRVGAPIRASDFHLKASLRFLNERFRLNQFGQVKNKLRLQNAVDLALLGKEPLPALADLLSRQGIALHVSLPDAAAKPALTYVDNRTQCAFDAAVLGEKYSFQQLAQRCGSLVVSPQDQNVQPSVSEGEYTGREVFRFLLKPGTDMLLDKLFAAENSSLLSQAKQKGAVKLKAAGH